MVKEVFTEKMTFEQIFEVGEGKSPVNLGRKNDKYKVPSILFISSFNILQSEWFG